MTVGGAHVYTLTAGQRGMLVLRGPVGAMKHPTTNDAASGG